MIEKFKNFDGIPVCFDTDAVLAFKQGKQIQCKLRTGDWEDWEATQYPTLYFGPWYHSPDYQWRVKPETVEFEFDSEVVKVVKVKVEIPAPFKGELEKNQAYFKLSKHSPRVPWFIASCTNLNMDVGKMDVKHSIVYLNKETAEKAKDILNG